MIIQANSLSVPLADKSVQCVVTSPPYYGLRDYGTAKWVGGDANCRHEPDKMSPSSTLEGGKATQGSAKFYKDVCAKCGAKRVDAQLGLEPTLSEYIQNTVLWAREVWRVLKDDGVFWLNIGDSYAGSGGAGGDYNKGGLKSGQPRYKSPMKVSHGYKDGRSNRDKRMGIGNAVGLKPKDLMLVPHRVAIALQDDGWWVRSDIVWHKPNPMPESVTDRPTKAHEYIFLLSKSKKYFYNADAVREVSSHAGEVISLGDKSFSKGQAKGKGVEPSGNAKEDTYTVPAGRNKRTVWTITTKPYPGSHFATFPPELPETCIKAGTSEKGECPECGKAWVRAVEREFHGEYNADEAQKQRERNPMSGGIDKVTLGGKTKDVERKTLGWKPQCDHDFEPVPQIVLDPFAGSGTTVMVANALGRRGVGLDLSWDYLQLAKERTGMKALEEWQNGKKAETNLEGLPMFDI